MKIRPLQDRIIVRRIEEEEKTKGGIIIERVPDDFHLVNKVFQMAVVTPLKKYGYSF